MNSIAKILLILLGGVVSTSVLTFLFYPYIESHTQRSVNEIREAGLVSANRLPLRQQQVTLIAEAIVEGLENNDPDQVYKATCLMLIGLGEVDEVTGGKDNIEFINAIKDRQLQVIKKIDANIDKKCLTKL